MSRTEAALQEALESLRRHYRDRGCQPPRSTIVEHTGISETTVQRYLSDKPYENPTYKTIFAIAAEIGLQTEDMALSADAIKGIETAAQNELILSLRELNIKELADALAANDDKWRSRLDSEKDAQLNLIRQMAQTHADEIRRLNETHAAEVQRIHEANSKHTAQIQQLYAEQIKILLEASHAQTAQILQAVQGQGRHGAAKER
jgi:transcriptional regulator with XRE-family HTH domain